MKPTKAQLAHRKALWAEEKANDAAASNAPWALGNLRLYQNMAARFWGEYYAAIAKAESKQ
jgi:hypothetical protein